MARRSGRVTGKAATRNRWWTKRRNQWIVGGVVVALLGAGGFTLAQSDSSDAPGADSSGEVWKSEIIADFTPMAQATVSYFKTLGDWQAGKAKAGAVDAVADIALTSFLDTRAALAGRAEFPQAPRALADYQDAVGLYVVHARLTKLGAQVRTARSNQQLQLSMGRLRYLADRLFDLGADEMAPFTAVEESPVEGFEYQRPAEVPSFGGTDLAPGPPLTPAEPATAPAPDVREGPAGGVLRRMARRPRSSEDPDRRGRGRCHCGRDRRGSGRDDRTADRLVRSPPRLSRPGG